MSALFPLSSAEPSGSAVPAAPQSAAVAAAAPVAADAAADVAEPQLDASKLRCYQVALELHTLCSTRVAQLNRIVRD